MTDYKGVSNMGLVFRIAKKIAKDRQDVLEDLVQEGYLIAETHKDKPIAVVGKILARRLKQIYTTLIAPVSVGKNYRISNRIPTGNLTGAKTKEKPLPSSLVINDSFNDTFCVDKKDNSEDVQTLMNLIYERIDLLDSEEKQIVLKHIDLIQTQKYYVFKRNQKAIAIIKRITEDIREELVINQV